MRGPDAFTEGLFTMRRLDDFVLADHPLRRIRVMVNEALTKMDELFSRMYEGDVKGGRPSIAPEKLLHSDAAADPVQRPLGTPAHEADAIQHAVSLVHRLGDGRRGVGADGVHEEPPAPDRARRGGGLLQRSAGDGREEGLVVG